MPASSRLTTARLAERLSPTPRHRWGLVKVSARPDRSSRQAARGIPSSENTQQLEVHLEYAAWQARDLDVIWQPASFKSVKVGDTLRVNGGAPFRVQAKLGERHFTLFLITEQGLPMDVRDTDELERATRS